MPVEFDGSAAREATSEAAEAIMGTGEKHMKLSGRQRELNNLWSYFRVAEHDGKAVDWNGRKVLPGHMKDAISRQAFLPPGYEPLGDSLPRDMRRPIAPLGVVRNIVSRFTGLLFSNRRQPRIKVPGDEKTEDYLQALLKHGQFWPTMIQARNYGGAMGSTCVGFRFINGVCQFEALDPRWCTPLFIGRGYTDPYKITVQYTYSQEEKQQDGKYKQTWYWYKREIDTETDTVWVPVKCREKEPNWDYIQRNTVRHGLGFVPYEWIQNFRVDDEVDGDPDCTGCYDLVNAMDQLVSEIFQGTILNLDPTLVLVSEADLASIKKGSDNAIKVGQGGSASYLELNGGGPRIGMEVLKMMEEQVYRQAQCVPDSVLFQNAGEKTATEIERIFSSMFEKADTLREQYGPPMVRLAQKVLHAVRFYTSVRMNAEGMLVRSRIFVPQKVIQQSDGDTVEIPRTVGKGTICETRWPHYQRPSYTDQDTYSRVVTTMLSNDPKVLTQATAIKMLAPVLDFDPMMELHAIKREEEEQQNQEALAAEEGGEEETPTETAKPADWNTALENGLVTVNEYRENLGLGALPDGDLTLTQYRAKHAQVFVASTAAVSEKSVDIATGKMQQDHQNQMEDREMRQEDRERSIKREDEGRAAAKQQGAPPGRAGTSGSSGPSGSPQGRPSSAPGGSSGGSKPPTSPPKAG